MAASRHRLLDQVLGVVQVPDDREHLTDEPGKGAGIELGKVLAVAAAHEPLRVDVLPRYTTQPLAPVPRLGPGECSDRNLGQPRDTTATRPGGRGEGWW